MSNQQLAISEDVDFIVPEWAVSSLVYSDDSNLSDDDIDAVNEFIKARFSEGFYGVPVVGEDLGFDE